MEADLLEIACAFIVLSSSAVPLYMIYSAKAERQKILSSILTAALLTFATLSLLESFEITNYQVIGKSSFVIFAISLIGTYSIFQLKTNHVLVGGVFGIATIAAFGSWIAGEIAELIFFSGENSRTIDYLTSVVMAGFGGFLVARYFWLRSSMTIETKYLSRR